MKDRDDTLVIIPAYNELNSIAGVVQAVHENGWTCLVIDDGSRDETARTAQRAGALTVSHATNLGVGAALRTGFKYAVEQGFTRVVQCDGDGQHRAELIAYLVESAKESGAELVVGSRFVAPPGGSMNVAGYRRFAMRWLSWVLLRKTGVRVHDTTSGFKCTSGTLLHEFSESFPAHFLGDTFEACLVAAASGYKVIEVPVAMDERQFGSTSAAPLKAIQHIVRSIAVAVFGLTFRIKPARVANVSSESK